MHLDVSLFLIFPQRQLSPKESGVVKITSILNSVLYLLLYQVYVSINLFYYSFLLLLVTLNVSSMVDSP